VHSVQAVSMRMPHKVCQVQQKGECRCARNA
jgi:hypothetical protein